MHTYKSHFDVLNGLGNYLQQNVAVIRISVWTYDSVKSFLRLHNVVIYCTHWTRADSFSVVSVRFPITALQIVDLHYHKYTSLLVPNDLFLRECHLEILIEFIFKARRPWLCHEKLMSTQIFLQYGLD